MDVLILIHCGDFWTSLRSNGARIYWGLLEILLRYILCGVWTQSLYMASPCVQSWPVRYYFLIYHAVIEQRAGTCEDISYWYRWLFWSENNYFWLSFYCIINVFMLGISRHLPHLFYMISQRRKVRNKEWVGWVLLSFSRFICILWWVVLTRCSINHVGESMCWVNFVIEIGERLHGICDL